MTLARCAAGRSPQSVPGVAPRPDELVAGLAQRALDRVLAELLGDEREQRRDPVDRVVLEPRPLRDGAVDQLLRGRRRRRRRSPPWPAPRAASPSARSRRRSAAAPPCRDLPIRCVSLAVPCSNAGHCRGRPSTRSAMMLRWISLVPPGIVPAERAQPLGRPRALAPHLRAEARDGRARRPERLGADRQRCAARSRCRTASAASAPARTCPAMNFEKPR